MHVNDLPFARGAVVNARRLLRSSEALLVVLAGLVGAAAGIATVVQSWLSHSMQRLIYGVTINRLSALGSIQHPWKLLALPLGGLVMVVLTRLVSRRRRPPVDVVEANALHGGRIPLTDNLLVAAQTIVSNGCGASVGLEATYAQMGGGIASQLGQWLRLRRADLRTLVGAGAGAGVGAAFGAPLTGAFYAFEIVIGAYGTASAAPVIAAALAAALVVRGLAIEPYLIAVTSARTITIVDYLAFAVLGLLCAVLGIIVMRLVTVAERLMQARPVMARWRPVIGGFMLIPLALISPQTLSAGHGALHLDLLLKPPIAFLAIVLTLKVAASVVSLASGFRGGLFFASLFLGTLAGQMFGEVFDLNPWGLHIDPTDAALVGMAAISVSIVGGPMTLAMLILETTHDFALTGVVLTASLLSALLTRETFGYSFSTWRLHVRGADIRSPRDIGWVHALTADRIMRRDWKELPDTASVSDFRSVAPMGSTQRAVLVDANGAYRGIVPIAAAWSPDVDLTETVDKLATLVDTTLSPGSDIKTILAMFDTAMADELAVTNGNGEVLGIVTEKYARRRYLDEIESAQRRLFGE
jgi:chloride channel protein, CIC family